MTRLALLRHAPTTWNRDRRIQGRSDTVLSTEGRAMAAAWRCPEAIAGWRWIASPLQRTRETAALMGVDIDASDDRLIEMDWGDWAGETLADLRKREGDAMAANEARGLDFRPHGGESPREVQLRLSEFLREVTGGGTDSVAITHRGVIRAALGLATGWDFLGTPPLPLDRSDLLMLTLDADGTARLDDPASLSMVPS